LNHPLHPVSAAAAAVLLGALLAAPAAAQQPTPTGLDPAAGSKPAQLRDVGFDQKLGAQVPLELTFRDSAGESVRLGDYFGSRPVVLSLVYYDCPMLCPMTMAGLASSLKAIDFDAGDQFQVVTVSFNPSEGPAESAKAREEYLGRYGRAGAAAGWHFLTGDADAIKQLTDAVGFRYQYDADRGQYAHATGIVVLTPDGHVSRYLFGIEYPPKDLRLGLVDAGGGTIGSPVDQVLLYCFHYDPATGKYTAASLNILRAGGVLTILALGGFILLMRWRERRAARADRPGTA
jgi:protein SCO1